MLRNRLLLACCIVLMTVTTAAANQPSAIWTAGAHPGEAPVKVVSSATPEHTKETLFVWQKGRAMVKVPAGGTIPAELPAGRACTVTVLDESGRPTPGIALQWKVEGWPNLPEPMGRGTTDARGQLGFRAPENRGMVVWVDDPSYKPTPVRLGKNEEATLRLVECKTPVVLLQDRYGRELPRGVACSAPTRSFLNPVNFAKTGRSSLQTKKGDDYGRLACPRRDSPQTAWIWAAGCFMRVVPSLRPGVFRLEAAPRITVDVKGLKPSDLKKGISIETIVFPKTMPWLPLKSTARLTAASGVIAPPAYPCKVMIRAEGCIPVSKDLDAPPTGGRLVFPMRYGVTFAGTVIDPNGQPIPDARVYIRMLDSTAFTKTKKDGSFRLPSQPPEEAPYKIKAWAQGYRTAELTVDKAQDRDNLVIPLNRGAGFRGRLVDGFTGQGVESAKLSVTRIRADGSKGIRFDAPVEAGGEFSVSGLTAGTYAFCGWAPGLGRRCGRITLADQDMRDLGDFALSSSPAVTGRVVDSDGDPFEGGGQVQIERLLTGAEAASAYPPKSLHADLNDDGTFSIGGVPDGRYRLIVAAGDRRAHKDDVRVQGEDVDVGDIPLQEGASLTGQLVGGQETNLSGWRITLTTQTFDPEAPFAITDGSGEFSFESVTPGTYRVQAFPPATLTPKVVQSVVLHAGRESHVVLPLGGIDLSAFVFVGQAPAAGGVVTVSTASGQFFDAGLVQVSSTGGPQLFGLPAPVVRADVDATGFTRLKNLAPGPCQISLYWNGATYKMAAEIPDQPSPPVTWTFSGIALEGRVVNSQGQPVPRAHVTLSYEKIGDAVGNTIATDSDGRFVFQGLAAGAVVLTAQDDSGERALTRITLSPDAPPPPVQLVLNPGGSAK